MRTVIEWTFLYFLMNIWPILTFSNSLLLNILLIPEPDPYSFIRDYRVYGSFWNVSIKVLLCKTAWTREKHHQETHESRKGQFDPTTSTHDLFWRPFCHAYDAWDLKILLLNISECFNVTSNLNYCFMLVLEKDQCKYNHSRWQPLPESVWK